MSGTAIATEVPAAFGRGRALRTWPSRLLTPRLQSIALIMAIIFPAVSVLSGSRHGPGLSPDSLGYVAAARSFAESGSLLTISGETMTIWPPGFPIVLGALLRLGLDLEATVVGLNVIFVMLTIALSYILALEALSSRALATLTALVVSVSPSTGRVFRMLWTEPPFMVLTLLVLVILVRACRIARITWWEIVIVGAAVALATSIRFVGFTLIPIAAFGALIASRSRGRARATASAFAAGGIASIGLAAVALRNLGLGAAALGDRSPSDLSLLGVLFQSVRTVGSYLVPRSWMWIAVSIGVLLVMIMAYALWRAAMERESGLLLMSFFVGLYWAMLWYSQIATRIDSIGDRLTAPIFTPMVILVISGVRELGGVLQQHSGRLLGGSRVRGALAGFAAAFLVMALLGSLAQSVSSAWRDARTGIGYNGITSRNSPLALAIGDLPAEAGVASNDAAKAYWVSGRSSIAPMPRVGHYWSAADTARDVEALRMLVASGTVDYVAIFGDYQVLTPASSSQAGIEMRLVATFEDGALYEVAPVK